MGVLGWLANIVLEPLGWTGLNIWLVSTFAISATHEHFRRITVSQHWLHTAPYSAPPPPQPPIPAPTGLTACGSADYVFWIIQVTVGLAIFLYWCAYLPARLPGAAGPWVGLSCRSCRSCGVRFRREERVGEYVGNYVYRLRIDNGAFRIAERRAVLDSEELGGLGSISFIL